MAQPVWITPAGSLGTIPEGVFYQLALLAEDPALTSTIYYKVIAGTLPDGVQFDPNGSPILQGVPSEVAVDTTSKFAIRAYTTKVVDSQTVVDRVADRTFTLTVTGPSAPEFTTPAGTVVECYDGSIFPGFQFQYTNTDPGETTVIRLLSGTLPPGTTLSRSGYLSGFVDPISTVDPLAVVTYEFTLQITDGISSNLRTFNIIVYDRNNLTADNIQILGTNTFITADENNVRSPMILTPTGSIGTASSDNFYAYKFDGYDVDGYPITYVMNGTIPGLTLDSTTGWLYGYIPAQGTNSLTYNFTVQVYLTDDPIYISSAYAYSLTIVGPVSSSITWTTPSNLGTIVNGSTSTFYVNAVSRAGLTLQYRLLSGSDSNLPQGLQLLPTGNIAGRCSFDTFTLDTGTTVFDVNSYNVLPGPTTFDLTFTFTAQVYSVDGVVNATKQFSITVIREYNAPYQNLYVQAMPPLNDRTALNNLLQDPTIFPPELIYRNDDPNFGVAKKVIYQHAFGLNDSTLADYYSSLYLNHYWKNLILGKIEVARATDSNGNTLYEVVYSRVVDNLLNNAGESVSKQVLLPYPIYLDDSSEVDLVYPNSLINMRDQVIDTVGQVGNILPAWMTSKQANGRVLGFVPAWVIAYVKPNQGAKIAYNISTQYSEKLNIIDFQVDRYELDNLLGKNWDSATQQWIPTPPTLTTFDITGVISSWINNYGDLVTWYNPLYPVVNWTTATPPGTTFDGGSLQFIAPVDMYSNTQAYDKYLVFPKRNILE